MNSLRLLNRRVSSLIGRQCTRSLTYDGESVTEATEDARERPRVERCINKVTLIGRLGKDGMLRGTEQQPCLILPLATNFVYKNSATGEFMSKTDWHRICVFSPTVMSYAKRLTKGDRIYVEGSLSYQKIKDGEDKTRSITSIIANEVTLLNRPRSNEDNRNQDE